MSKVGVNWHTKPKIIYSKSVVLDRFKRYLKGLGLRDETVKLYVGLVGGFLDYAEADEPSTEIANAFKDYLIEKRLSRGHINNTCFAVKRRQRTHAASGGASEALPHEVGARPSRSEPKLNTHALYPSRSELRGITFKNKTSLRSESDTPSGANPLSLLHYLSGRLLRLNIPPALGTDPDPFQAAGILLHPCRKGSLDLHQHGQGGIS